MALTLLAANNAQTVLAAGISASATSLTVNSGTGSLFPAPSNGVSFFKLTLIDAATGQLTEIMHVTARTGDTMTIERGQEGTTARAWSANDIAANMMTAGTLNYILANFQPLDATLTALARLATGANKLPYFTGTDTAAQTDLTSVGRDIIGKNTIADILTYLGLVGGLAASTVGRLIGVKMITSSQTYTPTTGTKLSIVELVGASGGSGGVAATGANTTVVTSPSSQGTYAEFIYPNPTSQVVTIGQGGSAGASGGGNGTSGGNSSFGSLVICPGGQGSYSAVPSAGVIQPAPGSASLAPTVNSGVTLLSSIYNRAVQNALQISTGVATNFGASPQGPMPGTRAGASVDGVYRAINSAAIGGNAGFDGACRIWEYA